MSRFRVFAGSRGIGLYDFAYKPSAARSPFRLLVRSMLLGRPADLVRAVFDHWAPVVVEGAGIELADVHQVARCMRLVGDGDRFASLRLCTRLAGVWVLRRCGCATSTTATAGTLSKYRRERIALLGTPGARSIGSGNARRSTSARGAVTVCFRVAGLERCSSTRMLSSSGPRASDRMPLV